MILEVSPRPWRIEGRWIVDRDGNAVSDLNSWHHLKRGNHVAAVDAVNGMYEIEKKLEGSRFARLLLGDGVE